MRRHGNISSKIVGMRNLTITLAICLKKHNCSLELSFFHAREKGSNNPKEKLLGGLLASEFDEESCLSRYHHQSSLHKPSPYKPSKHLISKLRSYEKLHKRCGPGTESYKRATEKLGQDVYYNHVSNSGDECRYVLWMLPLSKLGLGNRILSMVSVFLYALLTDRIMLVADQRSDTSDLFCEPFPGTSWLLPLDSPLMDQLDSFNKEYSRSYGTMLKNHAINSTRIPSQLYLYLFHDYGDHDKMFFCEDNQMIIGKAPWLVVKSNQYFVPSLWLIPGFQTKLIRLFPQKDTVFHHLGRYLFHPTNQVWGMVTRSYTAYLSRADERLGIQVRVFEEEGASPPIKHVMDQIVACTQREKLLPEVDTRGSQVTTTEKPSKLKAVLVTSLTSGYSETLKSMYWEHPTSTGEVVVVHQPSQEANQQSDKKLHNRKTLAEMYLLSLTDKVVISASSTFGYVAQGIGGLKPWILYKPVNHTVPDPPCGRAISMEPCFHVPPVYGCKGKTGTNTGNIVPFVKHCEDRILGIKLVQVSR
ncbi:probable fucosyltransferase 8 [Raphanus sativus]|uniref:Fucosyltransferase n=1 Tax=Raphanus sativus TaxID=3726 RepID=A0A9W3BVS5_RAPSA|nr:probable fucosyltransferase 8 [Raphanus sativus]